MNTIENGNLKTESKISIETNLIGDDIIYTIKTKKGQFEVVCKGDDGSLLITSNLETMEEAVGGRGDDDGNKAWFTDKHCRSNSEAASVVLELLMAISE